MSTTIMAVLISLIAQVLPWLGLSIGSAELTTTVQTLVVIGTGLWIWYKRVQVGDVNAAGIRKA